MYKFVLQINLVSFCYNGYTIPTLLFPTIIPERIKLKSKFFNLNFSFLLKIRDLALNLSSKFDIEIEHLCDFAIMPLNTNIDRLRKKVSFPVTNVEQLSLLAFPNVRLWEGTRFFDAFFSICRPNYIKAKLYPHTYYFKGSLSQ